MYRILHGGSQAFEPIAGRVGPRRCMTCVSRASFHDAANIRPLMATHGSIDLDLFRSLAWEPAVPVRLEKFHSLPAMHTWFTRSRPEKGPLILSDKLSSFSNTVVSYEFMAHLEHDEPSSDDSSGALRGFKAWLKSQPVEQDTMYLIELIDHMLESTAEDKMRFLMFDAPLSLIHRASRYNGSMSDPLSRRVRQLYVAQSDIRNLPVSLRQDLPVPEIVDRVGKGDIYSSSIWLGLQPTYTPLHRDPNPNLFCQLAGAKAVRLMLPADGSSVFQSVRTKLGLATKMHLRGHEMMHGPEHDELHHVVWTNPNPSRNIWEVVLRPGDALFIPQGWWHSVKSVGREAELNASANWWFR